MLNYRSFAESLRHHFKSEELTGSNQVVTKGGKRNATRSATLTKLPYLFSFQLKRFQYDSFSGCVTKVCQGRGRYVKVNSRFSFPAKFRLSSILPSISLPHDEYELVSVFIHEGTVRTGHYYSYSRAGERGEWVMFNDNVVEKVEFERVVANAFGCDGEVGDERASCGRASRLGLSGDLSGDLSDDLSDDWNGDMI